MSFRLAIPRWFALQHGPPPLRQPYIILRYSRIAGRFFFIERPTVSYLFVSDQGTTPACHPVHIMVVSEGIEIQAPIDPMQPELSIKRMGKFKVVLIVVA
jgi:hypothetical protein